MGAGEKGRGERRPESSHAPPKSASRGLEPDAPPATSENTCASSLPPPPPAPPSRIALRLNREIFGRTHVARALAPLDLLAISQLPGDARVTLDLGLGCWTPSRCVSNSGPSLLRCSWRPCLPSRSRACRRPPLFSSTSSRTT